MRAVVAALGALAAIAALSAADAPPPRIVRLDVIATDARGRAIETLTPADFDVREDGAVQTIEDARFIRVQKQTGDAPLPIQSETDDRTEAKRSDSRLVAVFLDDYHVSAANSARVRAAMLRFMDESLTPNDLVFVMRPLDSL